MSKHRFSTGLTETSSRKVFHDGCAKRDIFSQQILNKNRLCLAHCALNRSFTVSVLNTESKVNPDKWKQPILNNSSHSFHHWIQHPFKLSVFFLNFIFIKHVYICLTYRLKCVQCTKKNLLICKHS